MTAQELVQLLEQNPNKAIRFNYATGLSVRRDYHITELKNTEVSSVDCGGAVNHWKELVIQLWEPPVIGSEELNTSKVLAILNKVEAALPLFKEVELKFEYSNEVERLSQYKVGEVSTTTELVIINLAGQSSECKGLSSGACATPKAKKALADLNGEAACTPGGGCC